MTGLLLYNQITWFCKGNVTWWCGCDEWIHESNCYTDYLVISTPERGHRGAEPESFYHGFILGLLVDLRDRYYLKSNRESGFGRYDVMLEPKNSKECKAVILEFKVRNPRKEKSIQETVLSALKQICEKKYDADLLDKGIRKEQIYHYGFAFEGKKVLIGTDREEWICPPI